LDDFLINYAAAQQRFHFKMKKKFTKYRHITKIFQPEWLNLLMSQYIAHSVFKENGTIHKLLNHRAVKNLPPDEYDYLRLNAAKPWRFCFSMIIEEPAIDFYQMVDVFTGEKFLLYSQSTSRILEDQTPLLWFNLIGFNGQCWQSFGPISYFNGFTSDDIFFFATELNPAIESEEDLVKDIQDDPIPYMMLLSGANMPFTVHGPHELIMNISEYEVENFDPGKLKKDFKLEYDQEVFRLELKEWGEFPHFSTLYYDEVNSLVFLSAMTDNGYEKLTEYVNKYGYTFSQYANIRVHIPMLTTAGQILKKKISVNPYSSLFSIKSSPEEEEEIKIMNKIAGEIIPHINAGTEPDVEALAKKYHKDREIIIKIIESIPKIRP